MQGLTCWTTGFVVATCVLLFIGGLAPEIFAYQATFRKAAGQTASLAQLYIQQADDSIALADAKLLSLRNLIEAGSDPAAPLRELRRIQAEGLRAARNHVFVVLTADGTVISDGDGARSVGSDVRRTEAFRVHQFSANRDVHIGAPIYDGDSRAWYLTLSRRIDQPDGALKGVAAVAIELSTFTRFYAETVNDPRVDILLARHDTTILARKRGETTTPRTFNADLFRARVAAVTAADGPVTTMISDDEQVAAFRGSRQYDIAVEVSLDADSITAEWLAAALVPLALRLTLASIVATLGIWMLRQTRRQAKLNATLVEREAEFRALAEGSRDAILRLDAMGIIRYASPAARVLFQYEPQQLVGRHVAELAANDDVPTLLREVGCIDPDTTAGRTIRFRRDIEEGARRWYAMAVQAAPRDGVHGFVATVRDETDEHARAQVLHQQATTDPLTGLANRRRFDEAVEAEWRRATRTRKPLALLFFDADRFKLYNDTYGHGRGDLCLIALAKAIRVASGRSGDLAARYGGEEFVLMLPGIDATGAQAVAERVRAALHAEAIPHSGNTPFGVVTVSIGVAIAHPGMAPSSVAELVQAADRALYAAKAGGRNRVVLASDAIPARPEPQRATAS